MRRHMDHRGPGFHVPRVRPEDDEMSSDEDGGPRRGPRGRGPGRGEGHGPGGRGEGRGPRGEGRGEGRGPGRRGFGRPGGWQNVDVPAADDAEAWFTGRLPADWFSDVTVTVDREEIVVVGTLADDAPEDTAAAEGRISRFRADTRERRIEIALEAEARYGRKIAWGARLGEVETLFTHLSIPVMTRLRQPERQVLDTLVDAGVARSRSEALAWSVKLVGEHTEDWLAGLRTAMAEVDKLRAEGPSL